LENGYKTGFHLLLLFCVCAIMVDVTPADELEAVKLTCYTLSNSDDAGEMKAAFNEIRYRCTDFGKRVQDLSVSLEKDSRKNMLHALQNG
jgi:hypothetical protein